MSPSRSGSAARLWRRRDREFCGFIEGFYNRQRLHSAIDYKAPAEWNNSPRPRTP
jgi:transposase InsO family protein